MGGGRDYNKEAAAAAAVAEAACSKNHHHAEHIQRIRPICMYGITIQRKNKKDSVIC